MKIVDSELRFTLAEYKTAYFWLIFTTYTRVKNTTDCFQDYAILLNHIQDFDYSESSVEYFNEIVTGAKDLLQS